MYYADGSGATLTATTPPAGVANWVRKIHAPSWWRLGRTGEGLRVAIIDTGIDLTHPYLADAVEASASFIPGETAQDGHGHGTHVAGIIRQVAPGARLLVAKCLSNEGEGSDESLTAAIRWAVAQGAKVINASLGYDQEPTGPSAAALHQAIRDAVAAGVVFVASAGNEGHERLEINTVCWPARWQEPLAVAATWQIVGGRDHSGAAPFSSAGPEVDVTAPGTWIVSTAPGGGWVDMSGTSMAAPVVAGVLALLAEDWEIKTGVEPTEPQLVTLALHHTRDLLAAGRDVVAGVGEIDLCPWVERRLVTMTEGGTQVDVQESNTLTSSAVALTVPARIEPPGRFVAEFRGTMTAAGANEITWDAERKAGTAVLDVLPGGDPV